MKTILAIAPMLASCAAMFGRGPYEVPVTTNPPGATVLYGGRDMGRTPCTVRMVHGRSIASLHLDGYHSQEFDVGTEANDALVIGGFVLWGPFELLFDALSGAFVGLDDTPVSVNLAKSTEPMPLTWRRPIEFEPEEEDPGSYGTPPSYGRRP